MRQDVARIRGAGGIDRHVAFVDVLNYSFLIDHKGRAVAKALLFIKNSIVLNYCPFKVAEQWEGDAVLLGEFAIGGNAIYAETKNLSIRRFEFGDISLIRLHFLRSTTGEGRGKEGQHHIGLAAVIGKVNGATGGGRQREIRRHVTHL